MNRAKSKLGDKRHGGQERLPRDGGFTLVEVLVAVSLGSTVVALAAVVAVQSMAAQRAAESTLEWRWEHVRMFDQFEEDIGSALTWIPDSTDVVVSSTQTQELISVTALATVPNTKALFRLRLPAHITYLLRNTPAEPMHRSLIRRVEFLTERAGKAHEEILADSLIAARVEVCRQGVWSNNLSERGGGPQQLDAIRLVCVWSPDPSRTERWTVVTRDQGVRVEYGGI